jgi:hypothetical protein
VKTNIPAHPFGSLSRPAQRALAHAGIHNLSGLPAWREADIAKLHGIGPNALAKLKEMMAGQQLSFMK